ncbi:MAG: polysaccharide biosynthesis tyrosine autokinase [Lachnospiraceae bacterium]
MATIVIDKFYQMDFKATEAYKTLRTNLLFCGDDKKVIGITSCGANEGKSTLSVNLSISLAEAGKKVLLIDTDLRKSVLLGRYAAGTKVEGISHYLSGQTELINIINRTNIGTLQIIFAGKQPPNPSELLETDYLRDAIKALRKLYDYIIIDTAPLGVVIDAAIVARECDGTIMVVESGLNSYKFVSRIQHQLEITGTPILGLVLNKVDMNRVRRYDRKYGYYYKKYSHYYGK